MNILYIDHYAGSMSMGMEFRPYYLAREWKKMGHNVRIVGASFSHLRKKNPTVQNDFEIQTIDDIEFQWIRTREYQGNGVSRAITMAQFCGKLWLNAKRISGEFQPDVVIASSTYPLDTFPGQRIKKISQALLIHEIHDMWPITPIELYGMSKYHPFVVAMQIGENSFCRHADKIVSILPKCDDYLAEHGMKKEKFYYIPNGICIEDWEKPAALPSIHEETLMRAHSEGRMVFTFFGSHTRSYSLDYFLDAVSMCDQSKVFACFVGDGNYKQVLIEKAESLNLQKSCYAFLPPIEKRAIPTLLELSDVSYVGAIRNRMFRFGIGMNKLFDSLMGGIPILYAVDAPNNMIEAFSCGISVCAENSQELAVGIKTFLAMDKDELARMGANARDAAIQNFTYSVLAKKFLNVLTQNDGKSDGENLPHD